VAEAVRRRPSLVLGLATGATTVPFYRELVRLHRETGLSFRQVTTFNLDEYQGLAPEDPRSYHYFMARNFFDLVDVDPRRTHLPDGLAADAAAECRRYEQAIALEGGIDLQVLGIGLNGHIGFNEPGTQLGAETQLVHLKPSTLERNQALAGKALPEEALSLGVKTIMHARRLLLASGAIKAPAVAAALEGPVSDGLPASVLQLHPDLTVVLDEAAAGGLRCSGTAR
jgi:glucosamine-6-phosphate deaminase